MLSDVLNSGALPTLEAMLRFAGGRQRIIANNIANATVPGYLQQDVSVTEFQKTLSKAIEARREETGGMMGALQLESTDQVELGSDGRMTLTPGESPHGGILFHDRTNRDMERLMQDNAENAGAFRIASELLRSRMGAIRDAIAERVA